MTDNYRSLNHFDSVPTERELASERKQPPANVAPERHLGDDRRQDAAEWESRIARAVKTAERRTLEVVGETMAKLQKELRAEFHRELERRSLELRAEFLQLELDRERGVKRQLKTVPTPFDRGSLIG